MGSDPHDAAPSRPRRKLRIAFIIGSAEIGGAEHLVLTLLRSLPADEFDCSVICPAGPLVARYAKAASRVDTLGTTGGRDFLNPVLIARMAARLRRWNIDVVHTSLYLSDVGGVLAGRLAGVPLIVSHIVGHNFHVTDEHGWRRVRPQLGSWLYRSIYLLSHRLIAVSAAVKQDLIDRPGIRVPADKISVIYHSLPPQDEATGPAESIDEIRSRYGIAAEAVVVCSIGSLFPLKGQRYLLEAVAILVRSIPRLLCVIVGDGPSRADLEMLVDRLELHRHVVFTGVLSDARRNAIVECSAAVVLPSLSEGLPVVLLEAMAAAKPVVATDTGGVREMVVDQVSGVLVATRDAAALAAALVQVVSDPVWAEQLGRAGRCRLDEVFSSEAMIDRLRVLYRGAL